jgi:uncharacterized membrane protein YdbT with pleckstrin-like domain
MEANKDADAPELEIKSMDSSTSIESHNPHQPPLSPPISPIKESVVWSGHPSHIINLKYYIITLLSLIVIPPAVGALFQLFQWEKTTNLYLISISPWILAPVLCSLWKLIETRCHHYILTTERLRHITGVFNKHTEEIELYRVRDTQLDEPLLLRFVHAGNITIISNDASSPRFIIKAIKQPHHFRELLRTQVESCRQLKGVREWHTS